MCPYNYYTTMRETRDHKILRLRMVQDAQRFGVKPTAARYRTTPKTVRKWLRRFDGTLASLQDVSRRPHRSPRRLPTRDEQRIVRCKKQFRRFSAKRLKAECDLPYSVKAIRRVCKDYGLTRKYRRKKHQTKRCLREIKKHWRFLQQIVIDTKDLRDIPEYWIGLKSRRLPAYQYTARDVTTGLLWLGYADECSLANADLFAQRILEHLKTCGLELCQTTWQSDNGSEFIGSWQAKNPSAFTRTIESVPGQIHRTIPPGQHRFQADVETVHSLMEDEFFTLETFRNRNDFFAKADAYQRFFNLARKNSGKEYQTPWQLVRQKNPNAHPLLPLLDVVDLDNLQQNYLHSCPSRGYDVWALPSFM